MWARHRSEAEILSWHLECFSARRDDAVACYMNDILLVRANPYCAYTYLHMETNRTDTGTTIAYVMCELVYRIAL